MEHTLSTLPSIAASILANANALEAYFRSETLPGLGLGREAPIEYDTILKDPEAARARRDLVNDAKKLLLIALGPVESFYLGILSVRCDFVFRRYGVNGSTANPTAWWTTRSLPF
jgi:hypothetical protein